MEATALKYLHVCITEERNIKSSLVFKPDFDIQIALMLKHIFGT
jgi:hypothetical protein